MNLYNSQNWNRTQVETNHKFPSKLFFDYFVSYYSVAYDTYITRYGRGHTTARVQLYTYYSIDLLCIYSEVDIEEGLLLVSLYTKCNTCFTDKYIYKSIIHAHVERAQALCI